MYTYRASVLGTVISVLDTFYLCTWKALALPLSSRPRWNYKVFESMLVGSPVKEAVLRPQQNPIGLSSGRRGPYLETSDPTDPEQYVKEWPDTRKEGPAGHMLSTFRVQEVITIHLQAHQDGWLGLIMPYVFPPLGPSTLIVWNKNLESQWLIVMDYFKPIMVYFGV